MAGKKINDQPLVGLVNGNIKMPTGEVGDTTISVDQIKNHVLKKNSEAFNITTNSIPQGTTVVGSFTSPALAMLHYIDTNTPLRIRLYYTEAQRDADLNRPFFDIQPEGSGLIFEFVSNTDLLDAYLSPTAQYFATTVYYSITNLSGSTATLSCGIDYIVTGI